VREKKSVLLALKDPRVLILAGVQFGFTLGSYGVGFWLPQIIQNNYRSGSNFAVSLMSAIPYFFAVVGMLAWAWYIDRHGKSINHLIVTCLLSAVGLAAAAFSGSLWPSLIGITVALIGVTAARAIFWTIPPRFLTGAAAAGGFAFINSLGTVGGFVGPAMMGRLKDATGAYLMGILAMAAIMVSAAIFSASLKFTGMRD
jgi:cyanate permease